MYGGGLFWDFVNTVLEIQSCSKCPGGRWMDDSMLVLVREEFWEHSAPNSPFIDTEELHYHKAKISYPKKGISWQKDTSCGL